jgi:protein-tyrosine-phosphatase
LAEPWSDTVLFICEFGTAKSAIAREMFRRRARERGVATTAFSRGLKIGDHLSAPLARALAAERIDSRRDGFSIARRKDLRAATVVVAFTPLPARYRPQSLQDWSAVPSVNDNWLAARADLSHRIDALLDAIESRHAR